MSNNQYNSASIPPPYDAERRIYNSGGYSYSEQPKNGCCTAMGRIPYLTILGVLLLGGGCALLMLGYKTFAPELYNTYKAIDFNETMANVWCKDCATFIDDQAEKGEDSWYSPKNPSYIIADSCIAGAAIVFLLIVAILSTGYTRESCCQAKSCCQGYSMFLHFTTGLVVFLFLLIFTISGILLFFPMLFTIYLQDQCTVDQTTKPCFEMADFGFSPQDGTETKICFGDDGLCGRLDDIKLGFIYWVSGAFGAALGLVFVLMSNAANFAHFRDMKKVENEEKYVF